MTTVETTNGIPIFPHNYFTAESDAFSTDGYNCLSSANAVSPCHEGSSQHDAKLAVQTSQCMGDVFDGGLISEDSDDVYSNSSEENEHIIPLDYRLDWSEEMEDSLTTCLSSNPSLLIMEEKINSSDCDNSLRSVSDDWDMDSVVSVSTDQESFQHISNIPQWINTDIWSIDPSI